MECNHSDTEYCDGPAVRFAVVNGRLVSRCHFHYVHYVDGLEHARGWLFQNFEVTEQEAELFLVHAS